MYQLTLSHFLFVVQCSVFAFVVSTFVHTGLGDKSKANAKSLHYSRPRLKSYIPAKICFALLIIQIKGPLHNALKVGGICDNFARD